MLPGLSEAVCPWGSRATSPPWALLSSSTLTASSEDHPNLRNLLVHGQLCPTLCDPMDCLPPGASVCGISQARIQSGLPCPPPGDLPDPGIEPESLMSPALPGRFFTTWEARILEWVAVSFSKGSSRPKDITLVSCIAGRFFTYWVTSGALIFALDTALAPKAKH